MNRKVVYAISDNGCWDGFQGDSVNSHTDFLNIVETYFNNFYSYLGTYSGCFYSVVPKKGNEKEEDEYQFRVSYDSIEGSKDSIVFTLIPFNMFN